MMTPEAQMILNRCNEMRVVTRNDHSSLRPLSRTTDVNALLDRLGLGGRMRRV